jgi:O-antigen ligase
VNEKARPLLFWLLVIGLLAGLLGATAVFSQRQMRLRGALNGLPDPDLPYRVPLMGVNVQLEQYDEAELNEQLDLMADAGFVWLRQVFPWRAIEPEQGAHDWDQWDAIVEAVAAQPADLRLVAVLHDSPSWATDVDGTKPLDPADYHEFARAFAERYGEQIDVYQIWDEPNFSSSWGHPVDPIGYTELLRGAYNAIHLADPDTAVVLTGALASTTEETLDAYNDVLFLRDMYTAGARLYYDGVGVKAYDPGYGLGDRRANRNLLNFYRVVLLREEMEAHGDESRALWVSAFAFDADPQQQASWTAQAITQAAYEWPWVGGVIVDEWQPDAPPGDPRWERALRNSQGQSRPVYELLLDTGPAFQEDAYPGLYPASSPLIDYEGEWVVSPLGTNIRGPGRIGYVTLPFHGSEVALITRRPGYSTYVYVEINGEPSPTLPHNPRGGFLVVTSPNLQSAFDTQLVARGLNPTGRNVIRLEHERTWVPWLLVGFSVGNHIPTLGYDLSMAGLILLVLVSAWGVQRTSRNIEFGSWGKRLQAAYGRLGETAQVVITLVAGLAVWLGLAITWGATLTNLTRRLGDGPSLVITVLTAGVLYFSPSLLLTLAALVALFVLIYLRLDLGLTLVVLFTPFYLLPRPLYDRYFTLVEVVLLLCFAAWTLRLVASWREKRPPTLAELWAASTALDRATLWFVAISAFSLLVADIKSVAADELRTIVAEPALFYLMIRTSKLSRSAIWRLVDTLVVAGVVVSVVGLYEFTTGIDIVEAEENVERLRSVYGSPNNVGLYLGRIVPLALAVTIARVRRSRRILYALGGLLMLVAIGLSLSRGAILLGLPAGLALVMLVVGGRWGRVATGAALVIGAGTLVPLSQHPRFKGLLNFSEGTTGFRLMLWRSTLSMLRDHPLFGIGLDNFLYQYRGRYIMPEAWFEPNLSHPHNIILDYWVRLGIIGLAAGVWLQVAFWRLTWRLQARLKQSDVALRAVVVGLMGSMADFLAHGLVDNSYFVIDLAFVFFLMLGLLHQIKRLTDQPTS